MDGGGTSRCVFSVGGELSNGFAELQCDVPFWGSSAAHNKGWVQRDWSLDLQFHSEWGNHVAVLELLPENVSPECHGRRRLSCR